MPQQGYDPEVEAALWHATLEETAILNEIHRQDMYARWPKLDPNYVKPPSLWSRFCAWANRNKEAR